MYVMWQNIYKDAHLALLVTWMGIEKLNKLNCKVQMYHNVWYTLRYEKCACKYCDDNTKMIYCAALPYINGTNNIEQHKEALNLFYKKMANHTHVWQQSGSVVEESWC